MKFWKISHGTGYFNNDAIAFMKSNSIVSIHPDTLAKGQSSISQGEAFIKADKFDLFYVCRSNESIEFIGMFIDNRPFYSILTGHEDWVDREYTLIMEAVNPNNYNKELDRWWSPKNNSTFTEINPAHFDEFEKELLEPVFNTTLLNIIKKRTQLRSNYILNLSKISEIQRYFHGLYNNNTFLFNELNRISLVELRKLEYEFDQRGDRIEQQPVVLLRREIIKTLIEKKKLNDADFNFIKNEVSNRFEKNVFQAWSLPRIIYPFFFTKYKSDLELYLDRFIDLIRRKLGIEDISKKTFVHFDGAQNQGTDRIWFAIYNKTFSSQRHAYQLFFELTAEGFCYGLAHMDFAENDDLFKNKQITWEDLIDKFKKHLDFIINDDSKLKAMIAGITDVLLKKKQIILQGPPGTGKTYNAKNIAEMLIYNTVTLDKDKQKKKLSCSDQYRIIQFHPAYSYEDFIRGIKVNTNGNNLEYITENRVFAKFAFDAWKNYSDSKKEVAQYTKEKWVWNRLMEFKESVQLALEKDPKYKLNDTAYIFDIDEDAFRYSGDNWRVERRMKFSDLIEIYMNEVKERQDIVKLKNLSGLARDHATYFLLCYNLFLNSLNGEKYVPLAEESVREKNFILIIDEINRANLPAVLGELIYALEYRDEPVDTMYELDGDRRLIIPPNLYIIGTMNTADRSVGHIDYAIRRRFAFIEILPDENVITSELAKEYFKNVKEIFEKNIAGDFKLNSVMLGHSYFLADDNAELKMKMKYEMLPILNEYIEDGVLVKSQELEASLKEFELALEK